MNTTTPKPLAQSREFLALDPLGRIAVRVLWRRGVARRWEDTEDLSADDQVCLELEGSGFFLGVRAAEIRIATLAALLRTGAVVRELGALVMPVLSGDRPRDDVSAATRRQRRRRARLKAEAAAEAEDDDDDGGEAPPGASETRGGSSRARRDNDGMSRPPVTPSTTVTAPVTRSVTGSSSGEVGGGRSSSSSSSSSSASEQRDHGVDARAGAEGHAATAVTGHVASDVTPPVTPDVTPELPVAGVEIVRAFETHAADRVNTVAPGRIVDRAEDICREHHLTRAELDTMARMAGGGELVGQDKRKVTDLTLLVGGRQGEGGLLALWIGAARTAHAAAEKDRQRAARAAAQQQRDLPYGAGTRPPAGASGAAAGRFTPPVVRAGPPPDARKHGSG